MEHLKKHYAPNTMNRQQRLSSLDALRGLVLFLLVFLQPVLWSLLSRIDAPFATALLYHLDHEVWEGFRFWDLVMPLFLFMSGTSMPFSFSRFLRGEAPKSVAYRKIYRRFIILFVLGMIVQGNLLGFNLHAIYIYTNTLQAIAVGYVIAALLLLHFRWRGQLVGIALLLLGYALPMTLCGDFTLEGNLASRIDAIVLGRFQGDPTYAWLLPSLTFGVTVMLGAMAGQIIRSGRQRPGRTCQTLAVIGAVLVVAGWLWGFQMPIVKRIWTCSMTLLSAGYCFLLLAAFYGWMDVLNHRRGLEWLKIYGMNSIVAYMLGEVINFRSIVSSVSYGLEPLLGAYYPTWLTFGNALILFFILRWMYRQKMFVKI